MVFRVDKFGGGVMRCPHDLERLSKRLSNDGGVVVVSAFHGITRRLEAIVALAWKGRTDVAIREWTAIWNMHLEWASVVGLDKGAIMDELKPVHDRVAHLLHHSFSEFGVFYDAIVAAGEQLAAALVTAFLTHYGWPSSRVRADEVVQTDNVPTRASVCYESTVQRIQGRVLPLLQNDQMVVIEGFIGRSVSGQITTLGKEGSDYTAALVAAAIGASTVTLWKNVPGVLDADPQWFPDAVPLPYLSYRQAQWMSLQGAQVIHPRTLDMACRYALALEIRSVVNPQYATQISRRELVPYPSVGIVQDVIYAEVPDNAYTTFRMTTEKIPLTIIETQNQKGQWWIVGENNLEKWRIAARQSNVSPKLFQQGIRVVLTGRRRQVPTILRKYLLIDEKAFTDGRWEGIRQVFKKRSS